LLTGNPQPWRWVLNKTATFGWLFNARAESFEQNTVHRSNSEAVDRGMVMDGIKLIEKHGGKSGSWVANS
jgi:hypothetical protein